MKTQVFQSVHIPTNALPDTVHMQKLLHVSASGSYYDKGVRANLLIYVLFKVISLIKNQLLKYIKCIKYKKLIYIKIYDILIKH